MKDTPEEIASVMNLILPTNMELPTGDDFIDKYLDKVKDTFVVKKDKVEDLKKCFKGRVSFLNAMQSSVKKEFIGKKVQPLKHFIVEQLTMSKFQSDAYRKAIIIDETGNNGVHYNSRQASLMVFPDGTYGQYKIEGTAIQDKTKGSGKYVITKTTTKTFTVKKLLGKSETITNTYYALNEELIKAIEKDAPYNFKLSDLYSEQYVKTIKKRLENLRKYSVKYANVIESMLYAKKESCFVYSELITGSGSIVFSELLKLFGFSKATGTEDTHGLRYAFLTSDTTSKQIHKIIKCFNQPTNKFGEIIKVIIGSRVVSEGVSFLNVQREYILTPWYNYSETDQAIARGHRLGSHKDLLKQGVDPILRISQLVAIPDDDTMSIDLKMYELSENKDITIRGILRYMMESAFDCSLNYFRNVVTGEDGKRSCDYQNCEYKCDGMNMENVKNGLLPNEIDHSTYQIYYADPLLIPIRRDLEKYFRQYNELDINNIIKYFEGVYNEWEITNALKTIIKTSDGNMNYKKYIEIYSVSNVKEIMTKISELFKNNFRFSFDDIRSKFLNNTPFEILTALKNMIDENIIIKNKYGFSSYIRENRNIYFLVDNLSISTDYFSDYYVKNPNIVNNKTFKDILYETQIKNIPKFISKLYKITNFDIFSKLMKSIPTEIQELFIEAAIEALDKNIDRNKITRNFILDYFSNYIHNIDNVHISTRLRDEDILKCYESGQWRDCDNKYDKIIEENTNDVKNKLEKNPYGYYGQYNNETSVFSIVNVIKQKEKQKEIKEKEKQKLNKMVKKGEITSEEMEEELKKFIAGREIYPGRNCNKGWSIISLLRIAIRSVKLDYPPDFEKKEDDENIKTLLKSNKYIKGNDKDKFIYTDEEIDKLSNDDLRRALYWCTRKEGGYIKFLCTELQKWFKNTKWNGLDMLISDKQAGKSGGHKKISSNQDSSKKLTLSVKKIIPTENIAYFKTYLKNIQKLMEDCFDIKKYTPIIDDKQWVMIFSRKKFVAFLSIDKNNVIWDICVATSYEKKDIAQYIIQTAISDICPVASPRIVVDIKGKDYKIFINKYLLYGFTIVVNNEKTITMEFKCK